MKFKLINNKIYKENKKKIDSICYGIFDNNESIDLNIFKNNIYLKKTINRELNIKNKFDNIILYDVPDTCINRLLVISCGSKNEFDDYNYKKLIKNYINILKEKNISNNTCFLTLIPVNNKNIEWKIRVAVKIIRDEIYYFSKFKSTNKNFKVEEINFVLDEDNLDIYNKVLNESEIISDSVDLSKELSNLPSNICNSEYIYNKCKELSYKNENLLLEYLNSDDMKKLGMNAYLSVSSGSSNKTIMSILKYNGSSNTDENIVLIGKGVTFDTGGVSLKQSKDMDEMKFDMSGSSVVYGVMNAISKLKLKINVIGILATCENVLGSKSYKPGDIIKTLSNKTVEVLNTDAEGRLVLCDAIEYSYRFNPNIIIDIATLTGACAIALGKIFSGLMSNSRKLSNDIFKASLETDDKIWELPLDKENQEQIESNIADIKNLGDGYAGTITAAYFLFNFIKNCEWAHIDIAGTAYSKDKKSTGRPIYLITKYLINKSKNCKC